MMFYSVYAMAWISTIGVLYSSVVTYPWVYPADTIGGIGMLSLEQIAKVQLFVAIVTMLMLFLPLVFAATCRIPVGIWGIAILLLVAMDAYVGYAMHGDRCAPYAFLFAGLHAFSLTALAAYHVLVEKEAGSSGLTLRV